MNFIVRWLTEWLMEGFVDVFQLIASVSQNSFDNTVVIAILSLLQTIGLPLVGLSMLVLMLKTLLAASDGETASLMNVLKRCGAGVIIYTYGATIMINLYLVLLEFCSEFIDTILGISEVELNPSLNILDDVNTLIAIVMLLIMIFFMFKNFIDLTERFWQFLVMICMMYIYLPGYIAGDDESMVIWFKSTLAIMLTQIFQTVLIVTGMTIFLSTGSMNNLFITIGALVASTKVEQLMDRFGMGAGGKLGALARNGMSVAFYAKSIFK